MKTLTKIIDNLYIDKDKIFLLEMNDDLTISVGIVNREHTLVFSTQEACDEAFDRLLSSEV
jgi:hypothetical protein